jgi:hypothetical protein
VADALLVWDVVPISRGMETGPDADRRDQTASLSLGLYHLASARSVSDYLATLQGNRKDTLGAKVFEVVSPLAETRARDSKAFAHRRTTFRTQVGCLC